MWVAKLEKGSKESSKSSKSRSSTIERGRERAETHLYPMHRLGLVLALRL